MRTISIRQYSFSIREPHAEGDILTRAEAQALNALRAENIRNNVARFVIEATEADLETRQVPLLGQDQLTQLQDKITEYDLGYRFPSRERGAGALGVVEIELDKIVRESVEAILRQRGEDHLIDKFEYDQMVAEGRASPALQAEARRRVQVQQQLAAEALAEL